MRVPLPRPSIRLLMLVVAAIAIACAVLAPKFGPMFAPRPRIAIAGPLVATADIPMWTAGRHAWTIQNDGSASLVLDLAGHYACTSVPYRHEATVFRADGRKSLTTSDPRTSLVIETGGRVTIDLLWQSRGMPTWQSDGQPWAFNNDVRFLTNDPKRPELRLLLVGRVVPGISSPIAGDPAVTSNPRR